MFEPPSAYLRLGLEVPLATGPEDPEEVLLVDLPQRDPLLEILNWTEAPTEADKERLEASISTRLTRAAGTEEDE